MRRELTHGSLFSGIEGFGLGAALAGIKTEWSCEFEDYQTKVIKKKILEMDTQYMGILERLKTHRLLTSSTDELPNLVDRNKCVGNAVQPLMAQYLFECIKCFDQ